MNAKAFILLQLRPGTAPLLPSASIKFSPLIQKNYVYLCKLHTLIFYSFFVWLSMQFQVLLQSFYKIFTLSSVTGLVLDFCEKCCIIYLIINKIIFLYGGLL